VVEFDILPMLSEYWFDDLDMLQQWGKIYVVCLMMIDKGIFIKNIYYILSDKIHSK